MAKRKEDPPPAGAPAWMATFSDLMNLLLCFFVLLFSMSTVSEDKFEEIVASMQSAFSIFSGGATAIGEGILISNGVSQLNELDEYINSTGKLSDGETNEEELQNNSANSELQVDQSTEDKTAYQELVEELTQQNLQNNEQVAELIEEAISEDNLSDQIEVDFSAQYVQLSLKGALLFSSGSAQIKESAEKILTKVGIILQKYSLNSTIEIEGHTDNVPISSAEYANNDELSSARALAVFAYFRETTSLNPAILKHSGRGEWVPIADNSTEEGRTKNRRVEIKIYNPSLN